MEPPPPPPGGSRCTEGSSFAEDQDRSAQDAHSRFSLLYRALRLRRVIKPTFLNRNLSYSSAAAQTAPGRRRRRRKLDSILDDQSVRKSFNSEPVSGTLTPAKRRKCEAQSNGVSEPGLTIQIDAIDSALFRDIPGLIENGNVAINVHMCYESSSSSHTCLLESLKIPVANGVKRKTTLCLGRHDCEVPSGILLAVRIDLMNNCSPTKAANGKGVRRSRKVLSSWTFSLIRGETKLLLSGTYRLLFDNSAAMKVPHILGANTEQHCDSGVGKTTGSTGPDAGSIGAHGGCPIHNIPAAPITFTVQWNDHTDQRLSLPLQHIRQCSTSPHDPTLLCFRFRFLPPQEQFSRLGDTLTCPWCYISSHSLQSLLLHLRCFHSAYNFTHRTSIVGGKTINEVHVRMKYIHEYCESHHLFLYAKTKKKARVRGRYQESGGLPRFYSTKQQGSPKIGSQLDYDSDEDERHLEWQDEQSERAINDFADVSAKEKRMMNLWNRFSRRYLHVIGGEQVAEMLVRSFLAEHAPCLCEEQLLGNFSVLLLAIYPVISQPFLVHTLRIIQCLKQSPAAYLPLLQQAKSSRPS